MKVEDKDYWEPTLRLMDLKVNSDDPTVKSKSDVLMQKIRALEDAIRTMAEDCSLLRPMREDLLAFQVEWLTSLTLPIK